MELYTKYYSIYSSSDYSRQINNMKRLFKTNNLFFLLKKKEFKNNLSINEDINNIFEQFQQNLSNNVDLGQLSLHKEGIKKILIKIFFSQNKRDVDNYKDYIRIEMDGVIEYYEPFIVKNLAKIKKDLIDSILKIEARVISLNYDYKIKINEIIDTKINIIKNNINVDLNDIFNDYKKKLLKLISSEINSLDEISLLNNSYELNNIVNLILIFYSINIFKYNKELNNENKQNNLNKFGDILYSYCVNELENLLQSTNALFYHREIAIFIKKITKIYEFIDYNETKLLMELKELLLNLSGEEYDTIDGTEIDNKINEIIEDLIEFLKKLI